MSTESTQRRKTTPLPKLQISLALLISHAEPVAATVIFPFIPEFIRRTGITNGDEKKTGYYAGIIESLFFITECLSVYHWGRASDRIGRRPILLIGPLGLAISMLGFGLSKAFWHLVVFRCAQGIFNGNVGVVKTLVAEMTDDTNLADALTLASLVWNVGKAIGPAIGGLLSDPADRWPGVFSNPFFRSYPYFLACASVAFLAFIPFVVCFFLLKETRKTHPRNEATSEPSETDPLLAQESSLARQDNVEKPSLYKMIASNVPLQRSLISHAFHAFSNMAYYALVPLIYSTSIPNGGLGLTPYHIGLILGVHGFINATLLFFIWTPMLKRIGPKKMFIFSYSFHMVRVFIMSLARIAASKAGTANWVVWALISCQMLSSTVGTPAYNSLQTLIIKSAPQGSLGAVNGAQQTISSGLRGLAPTVASSLFAASLALDWKVSGGVGGVFSYLVDLLQIAMIAVGVWCSLTLPSYRLI